MHDAGIDAGIFDAGVADAGVFDAGVFDAGVFDAGIADAGVKRCDGGVSVLAPLGVGGPIPIEDCEATEEQEPSEPEDP
ncbi:hypothetical protein ACN469_23505 [Corallococcus terminator]